MVSRKRAKRECGEDRGSRDSRNKTTAAPATVRGERLPKATELRPTDGSGRRHGAPTRQPGNLPSICARAGRGASASGATRVTTTPPEDRTTVFLSITRRPSPHPDPPP